MLMVLEAWCVCVFVSVLLLQSDGVYAKVPFKHDLSQLAAMQT
jgi:hypothetical protein